MPLAPMSGRKLVNIVEFRAGRLEIATFAERPELRAGVFEAEIQSAVPEFMRHDPAAALYYDDGNLDRYRDYGLVAVDPTEPDLPAARAFSVPFAFPDPTRGREALPHGGWDQVIRWAHRDRLQGVPPTTVSALEIMVAPRLQGRGISQAMLTALRDNSRRLGFSALYAPIRPTDEHREPLTPPNTWRAAVRTGSHTIPGCAPISASAPRW
jgi:GNAT superfamily N-acetyltransferase